MDVDEARGPNEENLRGMSVLGTMAPALPPNLTTEQVLDRIFRDPSVKHGLSDFADLGKKPHEILEIFPRTLNQGRARGETRYYLNCFKRNEDIQVYSAKKSSPEEIVRQLWLYKLNQVYGYPWNQVEVEYSVEFGVAVAPKAADIVVFQRDGKTAKIVLETKNPDRKDGLGQLKSYLNAEGSPVGVWSNGLGRIILYRPYPGEFEDTLTELPGVDQQPIDVLRAKLTVPELKREFDFKRIIQDLEELVLASYGGSEFDEIFKLIFAKLYDEQAAKDRRDQAVHFRKSDDPNVTYETLRKLFDGAKEEWPGIFDDNDRLKLTPQHLQVCVGPLERIRLLGANMRVMDDAFEYLMPQEMKKKHGQFFTPRYVIDMCVRMLNPKKNEFVLDPACGSAGFLIHVLDYVSPADTDAKKRERKYNYAAKYLWGNDFGEKPSRVARASMLIAGDGRSHIFRVNSLDPREWFTDQEGEALRTALRESNLLEMKPPTNRAVRESEAWDFYRNLKFDMVLTNPPFAGEIRDKDLLKQYELASKALQKRNPKVERDVLFIERSLQFLKPAGRIAIILPQGEFNNLTLASVREWLLRRFRILAVVGLHQNSFKPHTGTKTSVLLGQRYTDSELEKIRKMEIEVGETCPDYGGLLSKLLVSRPRGEDLRFEDLPPEVAELMSELYEPEESPNKNSEEEGVFHIVGSGTEPDIGRLEDDIDRWSGVILKLEEDLARAKAQRDSTLQAEVRRRLKSAKKSLRDTRNDFARSAIKGKLELMMESEKVLEELRSKWVDAEIARKLDYPIFMATCELEGKNTSGEYVYRKDDNGSIALDEGGNPLILQDCVKYRPGHEDGIAEHFVRWAREHQISFWHGG